MLCCCPFNRGWFLPSHPPPWKETWGGGGGWFFSLSRTKTLECLHHHDLVSSHETTSGSGGSDLCEALTGLVLVKELNVPYVLFCFFYYQSPQKNASLVLPADLCVFPPVCGMNEANVGDHNPREGQALPSESAVFLSPPVKISTEPVFEQPFETCSLSRRL